MEGPPGTPPGAPVTLLNSPIGLAVASFLALSGVALLLVATVWQRGYAADLARNRNRARWVEYSLTSSMMIVVIAQITGISDVAALAAIFGVNASMIFFGWLQEDFEQPGGGWLPFIFGCIVGIVPWLIIAFFVIAPGIHVRGRTSRVRLRDHHLAVPVLQHLRAQPVPAVQAGRSLEGLPVRRDAPTSPSASWPSHCWRGRCSAAPWSRRHDRAAALPGPATAGARGTAPVRGLHGRRCRGRWGRRSRPATPPSAP